jgi:hypothetical protein
VTAIRMSHVKVPLVSETDLDFTGQNHYVFVSAESVAQLAEHRVVAPEAVGSSPITLPTFDRNVPGFSLFGPDGTRTPFG